MCKLDDLIAYETISNGLIPTEDKPYCGKYAAGEYHSISFELKCWGIPQDFS